MTTFDDDMPAVPSVADRSDHDVAIIAALLHKHLPFHCEMAGSNNVLDVARGAPFEEPTGGLRLDISGVLGTLSSIATVIQFCVVAATWARRTAKKTATVAATPPDSVEARLILQALQRQLGQDPHVVETLREDPALLDRIVGDVLTRVESLNVGGGSSTRT